MFEIAFSNPGPDAARLHRGGRARSRAAAADQGRPGRPRRRHRGAHRDRRAGPGLGRLCGAGARDRCRRSPASRCTCIAATGSTRSRSTGRTCTSRVRSRRATTASSDTGAGHGPQSRQQPGRRPCPVPPGETRTVRFAISWYVPNFRKYWVTPVWHFRQVSGASGQWRNWYATEWDGADGGRPRGAGALGRPRAETAAFGDGAVRVDPAPCRSSTPRRPT